MKDLTTDELCDFIVKNIGVPLPVYDYELNAYTTTLPQNISNGAGGVKGIDDLDVHETFKDGCIRILNWHIKNNCM